MSGPRRQATLFLHRHEAVSAIRHEFNPIQAALIEPHVTLVREDEVADWSAFARRVARDLPKNIRIAFGGPKRDGHLVLVPSLDQTEFDDLRSRILDAPRPHGAHVTLIHPRNGRCSDADFEAIRERLRPFEWTFDEIAFIEQKAAGVWRILERFPLQ